MMRGTLLAFDTYIFNGSLRVSITTDFITLVFASMLRSQCRVYSISSVQILAKMGGPFLKLANSQPLNSMVVRMVSGIICCLMLGFIFFGFRVFTIGHAPFQFTAYGLVGSISFSLFAFRRYRDALFVLLLLFALNIALVGTAYLFTHLLSFGSVVAVTYIFSRYYFFELGNLKLARPLILAGLLSILYLLITAFLGMFYETDIVRVAVFGNMPYGFLVGLGLGLGFELAEFLIRRYALISPEISS